MTEPVDPADPREKLAPVGSDDVRSPRSVRPTGAGVTPDSAGPGERDVTVDGGIVHDDRAESTTAGSDAGSGDVEPGQPGPTPGGSADSGPAESGPAESVPAGDTPSPTGDPDGTAGERPPTNGPDTPVQGVESAHEGAGFAPGDLAAERLADLQRLQAEYVNYKRRVDRDRSVVQERAVRDVLESLLPVLDDIHAAREHGDLTGGPFAAIADKLETTLGRYGLARFGSAGEEFDPVRHEALMHTPWPDGDTELPADASATTVVTVLQPGYRASDHVLRPARVAVADPP
ncbi:MAG: nucleotide exchange factor GrpE [Phycicoccus sp.]